MSDLHHLLERAAPSPGSSLDLDDIRRRVDRRRRRQRVTVLAAIVLVAVAAGVASTLLPDDTGESLDTFTDESTTTVTAAPSPGPVEGVVDVLETATAVAVANDEVWVVGQSGGTAFYVSRFDPSTGAILDTVELDRVVRQVEVAGGTVWAYGGGDGGEPEGGVVAIDAATAEVVGTYGYASTFTPSDLTAMPDGTAWVSDAQGNRVVHLHRDDMSEPADEVPVPGQPTDIVLADDGLLWVRSSMNRTIVAVDPASATVTATQPWNATLFAAAGDGTLWSTDGSRVVQVSPVALADGVSVALGARLDAPGTIWAVTPSGADLWVAGAGGLWFYAAAESWVQGPPTDRLDLDLDLDHDAFDVAVVGGDVWFVDTGGLHRWTRPS